MKGILYTGNMKWVGVHVRAVRMLCSWRVGPMGPKRSWRMDEIRGGNKVIRCGWGHGRKMHEKRCPCEEAEVDRCVGVWGFRSLHVVYAVLQRGSRTRWEDKMAGGKKNGAEARGSSLHLSPQKRSLRQFCEECRGGAHRAPALCDSHLLEPGAICLGKPGLVRGLHWSCFQVSPTYALPGSPRNTIPGLKHRICPFFFDTRQSKTTRVRHLLISGRTPFKHWLIYPFIRTFTEHQLCVSTKGVTKEKV